MSRVANRLSSKSVAAKREPGYYPDGAGLYLQVTRASPGAAASKSWILRFALNKHSREMGLGSLANVSLAEARTRAAELRRQLHEGKDPIAARHAARAIDSALSNAAMSFDACAAAYIAAHRDAWRNAKHAAQWENTLARYASPVIGALPVAVVELSHVMRILEPIWRTKTETAVSLRGRIESVLAWAAVRGYRRGDNPARWRGHLDQLLAMPSKVNRREHHASLPYLSMARFMSALRQQTGTGARALEFVILTAARSGEVRGATWGEVDLNGRVWVVPASRMKSGREHRVPLSRAAIALLTSGGSGQVADLLFPAPRGGPLSDMTLTAVMRRMRVEAVPHGFRSTFRDWCAECTDCPREVAEMALAHAIGDKVEAAYRRGDLFEKRAALMNLWGDYCAAAEPGGSA